MRWYLGFCAYSTLGWTPSPTNSCIEDIEHNMYHNVQMLVLGALSVIIPDVQSARHGSPICRTYSYISTTKVGSGVPYCWWIRNPVPNQARFGWFFFRNLVSHPYFTSHPSLNWWKVAEVSNGGRRAISTRAWWIWSNMERKSCRFLHSVFPWHDDPYFIDQFICV